MLKCRFKIFLNGVTMLIIVLLKVTNSDRMYLIYQQFLVMEIDTSSG